MEASSRTNKFISHFLILLILALFFVPSNGSKRSWFGQVVFEVIKAGLGYVTQDKEK